MHEGENIFLPIRRICRRRKSVAGTLGIIISLCILSTMGKTFYPIILSGHDTRALRNCDKSKIYD